MRWRMMSQMLLVPLSLFAQRPGSAANPGMPGTSTTPMNFGVELQIKVVWTNERPLTEAVHLQLTSRSGLPIADTVTDSYSIGTFRGVRPGSYRVRVTGINIVEATIDNVTVYRNDGTHQELVRVSPRDPSQMEAPAGTVSAPELSIPEKARKQMDKGMAAFDKGDMAAATEWLQKAVTTYPKYAWAWNNIGVIRARANDRAGAIEAWQKALEGDEKFAPAAFNLARACLADRQAAQAEGYARRGLASEASSVEGMFLLETALAMQAQWESTVEMAHKIHLAEHKRFPDTHRVAAEALIQLARYKEAVSEYEMFLDENPESPNAGKVRDMIAQLQAEIR